MTSFGSGNFTGFKFISDYNFNPNNDSPSDCTFRVFPELLQELEEKNRQQYLGVDWTVNIHNSNDPMPFSYRFFMNTQDWLRRTKKTVIFIKGHKFSRAISDLAEIEYY